MTPFKEDSDNFYGDVGHVKIAVRKDCSGIECERLRQLAQQVFLLDNQRGTSSIIDYEVEEDRSYIFLIYPPNHEQAPNPNLIVTRVPFRNLVVGLLSHQLLIQLIGTLLLQGSTFMVKSERNVLPQTPLELEPPQTPTSPTQKNLLHEENLPGMLPHLSTRNVLLLLTCLEKSYFIASQFDCRPGLKFLVQKVSRADVATNLYCYSSLSLTFLMHTLIVINSHMDNVCLENTRKILSQPQQIDANLSLDSDLLDDPIESTHKIGYTTEYITALSSLSSIDQHSGLFLRRLRVWFDEICKVYVDLYLDKEGPSKADELSSNMLVFLLAPEEELPQIKRDKSISEMVAEKLKSKKRADSVEQTEPVAVQPKISDVDQSSFDAGSEFPSNTCPTSPVKDRHQTCNDDKVYRVVTDKGIQSMMSEYKKRKQQKTMPAFVKAQRSKPVKKIPRPISLDPIDKEIDQQQQQSIMKDGEAHLVSFIEMLVSVLDVLFQLPDSHFQALQPAAFHCITQLICHCKDLRLRRSLAQWTHRIGHMFSLTAPNEAINKY